MAKVSAMYLPGVIEFYERLEGNHWQKAHDDLENAMLKLRGETDYFEKMSPHIEDFENTLQKLINDFRPFSKNAKPGHVSTAMVAGFSDNPDQLALLESPLTKGCGVCESQENTRIVRHPKHGVGIFCTNCVAKK